MSCTRRRIAVSSGQVRFGDFPPNKAHMSTTLAKKSNRTHKSRTPPHLDVVSPDPCALLDKAQSLAYSCHNLRLKIRQTHSSVTYGGLGLSGLCHWMVD